MVSKEFNLTIKHNSNGSFEYLCGQILNNWEIFQRNFPWRKYKDPYKIFVAELLLQRTFADKVGPIFLKMLGEYPDIISLSKGEKDDIIKIIEPLGLLYRAEQFIDISKKIVKLYGGNFPNKYHELIEIEGIGDYIASAISINAFKKKIIAVDTNIYRIVGRYFGINNPPRNIKEEKAIRDIVNKYPIGIISKDLNYSLLDFTANICKFYSPSCEKCFLKESCNYWTSNSNKNYWIEVGSGNWKWDDKFSKDKLFLSAPVTTRYINMLDKIKPRDIVLVYLTSSLTLKKSWKSSFVGVTVVKSYPYIVSNKIFVDLEKPVSLTKPVPLKFLKGNEKLLPESLKPIVNRNMQKYLFKIDEEAFHWLINISDKK